LKRRSAVVGAERTGNEHKENGTGVWQSPVSAERTLWPGQSFHCRYLAPPRAPGQSRAHNFCRW